MAQWVYFAGEALAGQEDTIDFAMRNNVIYRPSRSASGNLIANVGRLRPGDTLLLAYRQGLPHVARISARIAQVDYPVRGTAVVEEVGPPHSQMFLDAGYLPIGPGNVEVIHIEDVSLCQITLRGTYAGQNAIHKLTPEDGGEPAATQGKCDWTTGPPVQGQNYRGRATSSGLSTEALEAGAVKRPSVAERLLFDVYVMVDWS